MVLRKINVSSWDSPVSRQYGINSLPTLIIFDDTGKVLKRGSSVAMLADPTSGDGGEGGEFFGGTAVILGILGAVALGLFVLTKVLGPGPKRA
jgi:hypothetical protein